MHGLSKPDHYHSDQDEDEVSKHSVQERPSTSSESAQKLVTVVSPKSILKKSKNLHEPQDPLQQSGPHCIPKRSRKLQEDDDEIAALEKRLGLKKKRTKIAKAGDIDGLDGLLGDLDRSETEDDDPDEYYGWLKGKRAKHGDRLGEDSQHMDLDSESDFESDADDANDQREELVGDDPLPVAGLDIDEGHNITHRQENSTTRVKKSSQRPNPYIAPGAEVLGSHFKYAPPSRRLQQQRGDAEYHSGLRRQVQGLFNRLSESNIASIMKSIEALYLDYPRQSMNSLLSDMLLGLMNDRSSLNDTFVILHAGISAALYRVIGPDFGALLVEIFVAKINSLQNIVQVEFNGGKEIANLMSFIAQLYNFEVISSKLVFDFIRKLLQGLSEDYTELLVRIIRSAGTKLRHDDPSSLREIVATLQKSASQIGESNLSVRTKFMIETIISLKDNKLKSGVGLSSMVSEHLTHMKKTLGTLGARVPGAVEPLRFGLEDIANSPKKGKWWLVGASWNNESQHITNHIEDTKALLNKRTNQYELGSSPTTDLAQLAKEARMNTDIRKAIFTSIMSATDFKDAHLKLLKLHLTRSQQLEIPRVLLHCVGAEASYNPYYTLISKKLCKDRKVKVAFQYALWDLFKSMGERPTNEDVHHPEAEPPVIELGALVNLAKFFADLMGDHALGIEVFKNLDFANLQTETKIFVETVLVTVLVHATRRPSSQDSLIILQRIFNKADDYPELAIGLRYFMKKVVAKTDLLSSRKQKRTLHDTCKQFATLFQSKTTALVEL